MLKFLITLSLGFLFGCVLIGSQAFSWYRIQEMFHFQSFHMFGLLFSAIGTSALFIFLFKRNKHKSIYGNVIVPEPKKLQWKANLFGGLIFGLGWSISGACSAPAYILVGLHWQSGLFILTGAFVGTVIYALVDSKILK